MVSLAVRAPLVVSRKSAVQDRRTHAIAVSRNTFAGNRASLVSLPVTSYATRTSIRVFAAKKDDFEVPEVVTETLDKVSAAWDKTSDKPAVVSLGVFALVGLVALAGVLKAVESLPIIPDVLELIGIAYSLWFTYRYLLFKPDREDLKKELTKLKDSILG
eukprot:CAMPEP_0114249224 /NCGR_PEP_ID=MMETSP0058-20121206/14024_1 /TAXON_ID=36894 /ORGANISM="Pyramimonas parkeae, CCMP726" /LENGTH=159 /DNA_ID=CAMNT_0001362747 /DNA_START=61 /DNA_END=540 /DNA_ORIENTATION=-